MITVGGYCRQMTDAGNLLRDWKGMGVGQNGVETSYLRISGEQMCMQDDKNKGKNLTNKKL